MKRLLYLLIIILLLPISVLAAEVRKDTIDVLIHEDGTATFTEQWEVPKQKDTYFQKDFFNMEGVEIYNVTIVNKSGSEYTKVDKLNKNDRKTYTLASTDKAKSINMVLDTYKDDVYTITYDVKGMIKHYADDIYGIDFTFIGINYSMNIGNIFVNIHSEKQFLDTNTALYGIGKELGLVLTDGVIQLSTFTYDNKSIVRLFTKFTDIKYDNVVEVNDTFDKAYDDATHQNSYIIYIMNMISTKFFFLIGVLLVLLVIAIIVIKIIKKNKGTDEFNGIDVAGGKELPKYDEVGYYTEIPDYNLFKIGFLSSYFKIAKNRSDLVGALLLKWMYDGIVDVFPKDSKPFIRLNFDSLFDGEQLEKDLFNILKESSNHNIVDGSRLDRFSSSHYLRVMTWFNMGVSNVINEQVAMGNIKRVNKLGKMHVELQDEILNEGKNLLGLKKYLLNFNQVPRETQLTENTYKYLLIYAELFGIGEQVAKEILRKNPDNLYAKKLLDLEGVRHLYKNFFIKAFEPYRQIKKGDMLSDVAASNPDIDQIIQKNQDNTPPTIQL